MGKAFVAKLAKEGARDPEALAAWIGRKKHGKAFGKLAAAGRKESGNAPSGRRESASEPETQARNAEREREARAKAALQERAEQRESARENRPPAVAQAIERMRHLSDLYGSNAGGGRISKIPDERLVEHLQLAQSLITSADARLLDRRESRELYDFQGLLLRERRRRSQRRD